MAGERDESGGGGSAGAGAGQQDPGTAGQGGAGGDAGRGAGERAGDAGGAGKPVGVSPDVLPEPLRGKSDAELKFILSNMVTSLGSQKRQIDELKKQVAGGGGKGGEGREEKPEPKGETKPYEERILEDPEGTIAEIVEKRYGGRIAGIDRRTARSELQAARSELDDFSDYEEEVLETLQEAGAEMTFENITGAYVMAVGARTLEEKRKAAAGAVGMESGGGVSPDESDAKPTPKISKLEHEIAAAQGMSDEEFMKYRDEDVFAMIEVPTGKPRKQESA